ncbi:MAG: hypothetical protein ACXVYV_05340 [Gaiellales bacterium]
MRRALGIGAFLYDFVVGDDWTIAVGVGGSLGATTALHDQGVAAYWLLPVAVVALIGLSLLRAARR